MQNQTIVLREPQPIRATGSDEVDPSRMVKVLFLGRRFYTAPGRTIGDICSAAGVNVTPQHTVRLNLGIIANEHAASMVTQPGDFLVVVPKLKSG